jgi:hypothetical protein
VPLLNYTLAFVLHLRKGTENLSQGSLVATGLLVAPTWLSFEGQPRLACWTSVHPGYLEGIVTGGHGDVHIAMITGI